jgi:hypothetical protein
MNRMPPTLMRASIAVSPSALTLRHARGCPGRSTATRSTIRHKDESTKAVIDAVVEAKFQDHADPVRTEGGAP